MDSIVFSYEELEALLRKRLGPWSDRIQDEEQIKFSLESAFDHMNLGFEDHYEPPFPMRDDTGFFYPYEEGVEEWLDFIIWFATAHGVIFLEYRSKDEAEINAMVMFRKTANRAIDKAWDAFFGSDGDDDPDGDGMPVPDEQAA
jgi:hypothetical protein